MTPPLGRSFWLFWAASACTNLGDGIRLAAFPLLAAQLTGEPLHVGLVAAAGTLPWVVTGLVAGALADRASARRLMVATDVARVAVLAGLVALLVADRAHVGHVAAAAFLLGVGETVRDTTTTTVVPRLVPDALLERANGRLVAAQLVADELVGPVVGAGLFAVGAAVPFVATSATTALGALLLLLVPASLLRRRAEGPPAPRGLLAGVPLVARSPVLRPLLATTMLVALADSAWFAVLVLYAGERLGLDEVGFGLLLAVGAVGGVLGAALADRVLAGGRSRLVVGVAAAVTGLVPLPLAVLPEVAVAVVAVVATSAAFAVFNVATASMRARLVPEGLLGRVTAAWRAGVYGSATAGAAAGGALASAAGLGAPFVLSAVLGTAGALVWWRAAASG